jgi:hypothetical protein
MATTVTYYVLVHVDKSYLETVIMQYSQRHIMINHCDRRITHLSDTDTVQSETYHDKSQ